MTGEYFIGGYDAYLTFGLFPVPGFYAELLKLPVRQFGHVNDWKDENGTERDLSTVTYAKKTAELKFIMHAGSDIEIFDRYSSLRDLLLTNPTFALRAVEMDRLFTLRYVSMPSIEFLTKVRGNDNIAVELAITVEVLGPDVITDGSGEIVSPMVPEDIADAPVDLSGFGFSIVGTDMVLSGDIGLTGQLTCLLNGNEATGTYGLVAGKGLYSELMKLPERKGEVQNKFASRSISLPFYMVAGNARQFYERYYSLSAFLLEKGYFHLDVLGINRRFELVYGSMPSFEKLTKFRGSDKIAASLTIQVFDDDPTAWGGTAIYDGRFAINADGELIYSHSELWEEEIGFEIISGELIKNIP